MDYEVGGVADLIAGLTTPNRPRTHTRARTPTKRPPIEECTPVDSPLARPRAPRLALSPKDSLLLSPSTPLLDNYDSPKGAPVRRKSKLLERLTDPESDQENEPNKIKKKKKRLIEATDDNHVNNVEMEEQGSNTHIKPTKKKKNKNKSNVQSNTDDLLAQNNSDDNSESKRKRKQNLEVNHEEVPIKKKKKARNDDDSTNSLQYDKTDTEVVKTKKSKKNKGLARLESTVEEPDVDSAKIRKKKRGESATEHEANGELLPTKKPLKNRSKKSKTITEDLENAGESAEENEIDDNGPTDFQKAAQRRIEQKTIKNQKFEADELDRTLFIGNVPISILKMSKFKKVFHKRFGQYGEIESVRLRNIPVADLKTKPKLAFIHSKVHSERSTVTAYIKFKNAASVAKALVEDNSLFEGNHIRVDSCTGAKSHDTRRGVFLGNLPFNIEEETLRELFERCGPIDSVRVIRDKKTQMGKGFGFVNFEKPDGAEFALNMPEDDLKINGKTIRVQRQSANPSKDVGAKREPQKNSTDPKTPQGKNYGKKRDEQGNKLRKRNLNGVKSKRTDDSKPSVTNKPKTEKSENRDESYIGVMAKKKKKHKLNKGVLKKKKISKILLNS